jgi:hypothetical protein
MREPFLKKEDGLHDIVVVPHAPELSTVGGPLGGELRRTRKVHTGITPHQPHDDRTNHRISRPLALALALALFVFRCCWLVSPVSVSVVSVCVRRSIAGDPE